MASKHDQVVEDILNDPTVDVREDGTIWRQFNSSGWKQVGRIDNAGYFYMKYKNTGVKVHRIVYAKFCGPLTPELVIDHIDGDPYNNVPENLQQVTHAVNIRKGKAVKLSKAEVSEIKVLYRNSGLTQKDIGELYGVCQPHICKILKGLRWEEN